jgi:hypothetical protein
MECCSPVAALPRKTVGISRFGKNTNPAHAERSRGTRGLWGRASTSLGMSVDMTRPADAALAGLAARG